MRATTVIGPCALAPNLCNIEAHICPRLNTLNAYKIAIMKPSTAVRPIYMRGSLRCYLDRCRGYLVNATPEEAVRQDVLDWLIDELGVPERCIRTEFSQRRRGGEGRADVIVLAPGASDTEGDVLMVVECKRPGMFLDERVLEQAAGYAKTHRANFIVLANGEERRPYALEGKVWKLRRGFPKWKKLLVAEYGDVVEEEPFMRWAWCDIATPEAARAMVTEQELGRYIGEDSADELLPFALNLFGLLVDGHKGPRLPLRSGDLVIEQDLGQRSRGFGTSVGTIWGSDCYRSFLVHDSLRETYQVVSLTLFANAKLINHPRFGNTRGRTMLIAGVDDGPTTHVAYEMGLDEAIDPHHTGRLVEVSHNGGMTLGKRGAVKREVVRAEMTRHGAGDLIRGGRVVLGRVFLRAEMTWRNASELVGNLIRYALIRDRVRETLREGTAMSSS